MADKFKAGDIVTLKSGGPNMVIERVNKYSTSDEVSYVCSWFAGAKDNSKSFTEPSLKLSDRQS